ncbi:MAG: aldo/keto reductase [Acidimicrobiales bacterium]
MVRREIEAEVLPDTATHDIGVLVYGPLAHGLLGGNLQLDTRFAPGDWRANSPVFQGEAYRRNLQVVAELRDFAGGELGITLGQLAIAWTLANPAVQVAIVGTRNPNHVDEALAAAEVELDDAAMERIDELMRYAVPIGGPTPDSV